MDLRCDLACPCPTRIKPHLVVHRLVRVPKIVKGHPGTDAGPRLAGVGISFQMHFFRHCQSKFYTACSRSRARWRSTVFARELPPRSAGLDAENRLYLFALTMPPVGGARQYCGRLGKTDNCQIAVTPSIANHAASLPIAYQLYLPEDWAGDEARRKKVRVPGRFRRPIRWNGFPSNGPRAKKSRRNTGFRPCPRTRPSTFSSTPPNCSSWNLI